MKYLLIENTGELEADALTLLGGTTKDGVNTIGMFGTGNKYAISYFLRNKYELKVFSGLKEIPISTEKVSFRGNDFEVICIDNEKTSITTDMGVNWTLWMALREFYCNAIDEGKTKFEPTNEIIPIEGYTQFYIEYRDEVKEFISNFDNYFAENKKVVTFFNKNKVLKKHDEITRIYRRGILVGEFKQPSAYDYDIYNLDISESRTYQYKFQIDKNIIETIFSCEDINVFDSFMTRSSIEGSFESNIEVSYACCKIGKVGTEWLSNNIIYDNKIAGFLESTIKANAIGIGHYIYSLLKSEYLNLINIPSILRGNMLYKPIKHSTLLKPTVNGALSFLKKCKFPINHRIKIVSFQDEYIHGYADEQNKQIFISDTAVKLGIQHVALVLIEEELHLTTGHGDCTREFQTSILEKFIDYMKLVNKHPL